MQTDDVTATAPATQTFPGVPLPTSPGGADDLDTIVANLRRGAVMDSSTTASAANTEGVQAAQRNGTIPCPLNAFDEASLNTAIVCANGAGEGTHTIQVTANISLTQSTTMISNTHASAIIIAGNTYTVDGEQIAGTRIFKIATGTTVQINQLTITEGNADDGGGIWNAGWLTLHESNVMYNHANRGGGIFTTVGGKLTLRNSELSHNTAQTDGGGLYVDGAFNVPQDAEVEIIESTIHSNQAQQRGGGLYNDDGPVIIDRSTFRNNQAESGGAADNVDGGILLVNSTVSNNTATQGGAIRHANSGSIFFHSTVTANSTTTGAAIASEASSGVALFNTIVANQQSGGDCLVDNNSEFLSQGNNLDSDGSCALTFAGDIASGTANLGPLQDNGGPTWTHALLPGSAAIEAGNDEYCSTDIVNNLDQRSTARPQGLHCDIGAYEYQFPGADLGVEKTEVADPVDRGANIEYLLTVTNYGPETAVNVVLGDTLPADVAFISATPSQGNCQQSAGQISCTLGDLTDDSQATVAVVVATSDATASLVTNYAEVHSDTNDATPGNNSTIEATLVCDYIASDEQSLNVAIACANAAGAGIHTIQVVDNIQLSSPPTIDDATKQLLLDIADDIAAIILSSPPGSLTEADLIAIVDLLLTAPDTLMDNATIQRILVLLQTALSLPISSIDANVILDILLHVATVPFDNPLATEIVVQGNGYTIDANQNSAVVTVLADTRVHIQDLHLTNASALLGSSVVRNFGTVTLNRSTIYNNTAALGSTVANFGSLMIVNSTLSGNNTQVGGTISNFGLLHLLNSTLTANQATNSAALRNFGGQSTLVNTIVAQQAAGADCSVLHGTILSRGHNLDSDNSCQLNATGDLPNQNPQLGPLQDNGGQTLTHALLEGSPAIDAGLDDVCDVAPVNAIDQRGVTRYEGPHCDIGAYELDVAEYIHIVESNGISEVTEGNGSVAGYWLSLSGRPQAPVIIAIKPDKQVTTNLTRWRFDKTNWNKPKLILISAIDDAIAEGDHHGYVYHHARSTDPRYDGNAAQFTGNGPTAQNSPSKIRVYITDNDEAGVRIRESNGISDVMEGKRQPAGYWVKLQSQPVAPVTVVIQVDEQVVVDQSQLTFTADNWHVEQLVLIRAVDDDWAEGDHTGLIQHSLSSTDPNYNGNGVPFTGNGPTANTEPSTILVYITDNEVAGVTITPQTINLLEASIRATARAEALTNQSNSYQIVLTSKPRQPVTIQIQTDSQSQTDRQQVVFDQNNWNQPQSVLVTTVDDAVAEGPHQSSIQHQAQSGDVGYDGLAVAGVQIAIADDDSASVNIMQGLLTLVEGSSADYSLTLTSKPAGTVTIHLEADESLNLSRREIHFGPDDWYIPQSTTVTSRDNHQVEGTYNKQIRHTATGSDASYSGIFIPNLNVEIKDNDSAAVVVSQQQSAIAENGAEISYQLVLKSEPSAPVVVTLNNDTQVNAHGADGTKQLTFDAGNWNKPQMVSVRAIDDAIVEGSHVGRVTHNVTSGDSTYQAIDTEAATFTVQDNDQAAVTVVDDYLELTEGASAVTYAVALTSQPGGIVTIAIHADDQLGTDKNHVIFTPNNWNQAQLVNVVAHDDEIDEGIHTGLITHTINSGDSLYANLSVSDLQATITDNDVAAIHFAEENVHVAEGSAGGSYLVALATKPQHAVTVVIQSDGQTTVSNGNGSGTNTMQLIFEPNSWDIAQRVFVAAVDDLLAEGLHKSVLQHTASSQAAQYNDLPVQQLTVDVADNDSPGVEITPGSLTVKEAVETATYQVRLATEPATPVLVTAMTEGKLTLNGEQSSRLRFDATNWHEYQTVEVAAPDDQLIEANETIWIHHTAASAASDYSTISVPDVMVSVIDDDATSDPDGDNVRTGDEDRNGDGDPTNDDTDRDGTPDYLDPDDDGDEIPTIDEDANGDGDPMNDDTDGDDLPDYLDPIDDVVTGAGSIQLFLPIVSR